jgi:endonuclease YncB( thermonuclease family)
VNGPLLGLLACLLVFPWSPARAQCPRGTLVGEVTYVRDGDTIELGRMAIRLQGLAAPEWDEPLGTEAREAIIKLVQGRTLHCELDGDAHTIAASRSATSTARTSRRLWLVVAWPGTAPGSAVGAMPR